MKKYIESYIESVKSFISDDNRFNDKKEIIEFLEEFDLKVSYFQHERLIHLIVTVLFAIMEIMSVCVLLISVSIVPIILCFMFLVLLIPYVMHYYFLENSVQEMYKQRDIIYSKLKFLSDSE